MNTTLKIKNLRMALALCVLSCFCQLAFAHDPAQNGDIKIENAWVRATVQGQKATGAFMTLTSKSGYTLSAVKSPVAEIAEVHEMKMEGQIMKMRALEKGLELPAGQAVELRPGGYHIMLMDLNQTLPNKSEVQVTLTFKDKQGKAHSTSQILPVSDQAVQGMLSKPVGDAKHHHDHHGKAGE